MPFRKLEMKDKSFKMKVFLEINILAIVTPSFGAGAT